MKDNWSDKNFVEDWDNVVSQGNPTRPEQLDILTTIIVDNYEPGSYILDIGCGSGQVEELIFKKQSEAKIVGLDSSQPMLELAAKRLKSYGSNFMVLQQDISSLNASELPVGNYKTVFSAQALHELDSKLRRDLFTKVSGILPKGGMFAVMDGIKVDLENLGSLYKSAWQRLENLGAYKTAGDFEGYKRRLNDKEDSPGSLEEYRTLFLEAGFKFAILHLNFDRAVIIGVKE